MLSRASLMLSCQSSFLPVAQTADFTVIAITLMKEWGLGSELTFRKILGFYLKIGELDLNYCKHSYIYERDPEGGKDKKDEEDR